MNEKNITFGDVRKLILYGIFAFISSIAISYLVGCFAEEKYVRIASDLWLIVLVVVPVAYVIKTKKYS